jgi:hypothetical protein
MALYKHGQYLQVSTSSAFDVSQSPGEKAANPGVYRCVACGHEIGIAKDHTLPPQNHHQHKPGIGAISWQLIVCAVVPA